ncbi:MAG: cyclic peptide export ABC transporter [Cyanobacteria bacterium P01_D01_bin.36]
MDIIWLLLKASRGRVLGAIAAGLISGGCSAGLIALINEAITHAITPAVTQGSPRSSVAPFIGLVLLSLLASSLSQFLLIDLAQDAVYKLRLQLSQRILSAPLPQLEQLGPSQLLAVLTKDVQSISNVVFVIPRLCINAAIIGGCLIYLGWLSAWALLAVIVFLVVAIAIVQLFINAAYRYLSLARKELDRLFKLFGGITNGTKELKLNTLRRTLFINEDLKTSATTSRNYTKTAFKIGALATSSGQLLFFVLIGLLLFAAKDLIPNFQSVLPAYILTITYIIGPIEIVIDALPNLATANVAMQKVENMGLSLIESAEIPTVVAPSIATNWQTLRLKEVTYRYQKEEGDAQGFSVGPINLEIQRGELLFIVGGNGSGKSTLAKLITGLYAPSSGQITLDTEPITDKNREWYRQRFSTVFYDFHLFKRLVGENQKTLETQAQTYLKKLNLEEKVSIANGEISTMSLSQGQRKRLALLAAYLEDRPIYLFDEWAADQDPVFREIFYTQLLLELKQRGKTVIVISHDSQYFYVGDRIISLDYGQIEITK